jgi:hypothetical protein
MGLIRFPAAEINGKEAISRGDPWEKLFCLLKKRRSADKNSGEFQ